MLSVLISAGGKACKCCSSLLAYSSSFSASLLKSLHLQSNQYSVPSGSPGLRFLLQQLKLCSPGLRQGEWVPDASGSAVLPLHTAALGLSLAACWNVLIHKCLKVERIYYWTAKDHQGGIILSYSIAFACLHIKLCHLMEFSIIQYSWKRSKCDQSI